MAESVVTARPVLEVADVIRGHGVENGQAVQVHADNFWLSIR